MFQKWFRNFILLVAPYIAAVQLCIDIYNLLSGKPTSGMLPTSIGLLVSGFSVLVLGVALNRNASIEYPPGLQLRYVFQFVYTKKVYERIFAEQISDMEIEYIEALSDKRPLKAKWVVVRAYLILVLVAIQHFITSTLGILVKQILK